MDGQGTGEKGNGRGFQAGGPTGVSFCGMSKLDSSPVKEIPKLYKSSRAKTILPI
jgi:hypothetical protein